MAEEHVQRRLAAILVADLVGHSRLMREDEVGTFAQPECPKDATCYGHQKKIS